MSTSAEQIDLGKGGNTERQLNTAPSSRPLATHLIADLEQCDLSGFVPDEHALDDLRRTVTAALADANLTEVGRHYHFFGPGAVTATVCLAESHFNFHSWPEFGYVSLDILCCTASASTGVGGPAAGAGEKNGEKIGNSKLEQLITFFSEQVFRAGRIKKTVVFR